MIAFLYTFLFIIYIMGVATVITVAHIQMDESDEIPEYWTTALPVSLVWPLFIPMFIQIYLKK